MIQPITRRLFIGIPLANRFRPFMSTWVEELQKGWHFKSWVHPADYHITLKYLGETDFATANQVKSELKALSVNQAPITIEINGLGVFGPQDKPQILWADVKGELDKLFALQSQVENKMHNLGFRHEDRPYKPHLTLARKYQGGSYPITNLHEAIAIKEGLVKWQAREIVLFESQLNLTPKYRPLSIFPLQG